MDEIETFLETLLGNSPTQYKSIAQKAIDIYQGRGELTVKQHAWALWNADAQRVAVPKTFHDVKAFEPKTRTYFPDDTPTEPEIITQTSSPSIGAEDREFVAETMATVAQLLVMAAERLRRP